MKMKTVVIFVDTEIVSRVEQLFEECDVDGDDPVDSIKVYALDTES